MGTGPPPAFIVGTVTRFAPGFWPSFVNGINGAALAAGVQTRVSSWYRNPLENRVAGGSPDSQHLVGAAVDLVDTAAGMARLHGNLAVRGFRVVPYGTHLHVQSWPAGAARSSGLLAVVGA